MSAKRIKPEDFADIFNRWWGKHELSIRKRFLQTLSKPWLIESYMNTAYLLLNEKAGQGRSPFRKGIENARIRASYVCEEVRRWVEQNKPLWDLVDDLDRLHPDRTLYFSKDPLSLLIHNEDRAEREQKKRHRKKFIKDLNKYLTDQDKISLVRVIINEESKKSDEELDDPNKIIKEARKLFKQLFGRIPEKVFEKFESLSDAAKRAACSRARRKVKMFATKTGFNWSAYLVIALFVFLPIAYQNLPHQCSAADRNNSVPACTALSDSTTHVEYQVVHQCSRPSSSEEHAYLFNVPVRLEIQLAHQCHQCSLSPDKHINETKYRLMETPLFQEIKLALLDHQCSIPDRSATLKTPYRLLDSDKIMELQVAHQCSLTRQCFPNGTSELPEIEPEISDMRAA